MTPSQPNPMKLLSSCFRAFKLLLLFYAGGTGILTHFSLVFLIGGLMMAIALQNWADFTIFTLIALAALLCGLLWFLFSSALYALLLKLLWSKPPAWSRITFSKRDWLLSYVIGTIASLPGSLLIIGAAGDSRLVADLSYLERETPIAVQIIAQYWWLWFIATWSLYGMLPGNSKSVPQKQSP